MPLHFINNKNIKTDSLVTFIDTEKRHEFKETPLDKLIIGDVFYRGSSDKNFMYTIYVIQPSTNDSLRDIKRCYKNALIQAQELGSLSLTIPLMFNENLDFIVSYIKKFLEVNDLIVNLIIKDKDLIDKYINHDLDTYLNESLSKEENIQVLSKSRAIIDEDFTYKDDTWQESLMKLIIDSGKTNADVYKKANLSRQHFSKILKDPDYHPTKPTAIAFCLALDLDIDQSLDLLEKAGYQLSYSITFDIIVRFFLERQIFDIYEINQALFKYDQELLGSRA